MYEKIKNIGISESLNEDQVLKTNSLVVLSMLIAIAGVLWGGMYWFLGYLIPSIFPFSFSILIVIGLFVFSINKNFSFLLRTKLFLILIIPFFLQMSLGGFMPSGAVLFWSLLAPIGAIMFSSIKESAIWFALFFVLFVLCLFCGKINSFEYDSIPLFIQQVFLGMNITAVTLISFYTTMFFVKGMQKERYKNKLLLKSKNEKQKEINDSIQYAKYIQESILTNPDKIKKHFKDSFIYSKPKDIVSGDFYWLHEEEDRLMIAVADSTGHGVPGAMVSLVCSNALNTSVVEYGLKDPDLILNKTRDIVIKTLSSKHDMCDGMDIAFCSFNKEQSQLCFSGAINPIYIIRDNELIILKGDRFPVGKYITKLSYSKTIMKIEKGDCIYMFSDGYSDQFGGGNKKKMKVTKFKEFLLKISSMPMNQQKNKLDVFFNNWRGDMEQVDDVLVVGLKVL